MRQAILQMMSNLLYQFKILTTNSESQEKFLLFTECVSGMSGEALEAILKHVSGWALDLTFLQGQAYDGAGAMAGCSRGVATHIQDKFPSALYTHCTAHRFTFIW